MNVSSIHIDGFGTLSDLALENLGPGLTAIYGRNGSGKTTIIQFLRGVMLGV